MNPALRLEGMVLVARAVLRYPSLWSSALGALWRFASPGWWKRSPFLPLPDRRLWEFRMVTAYGRPDGEPLASDVVSYLRWCRSTGRTHRYPRRQG